MCPGIPAPGRRRLRLTPGLRGLIARTPVVLSVSLFILVSLLLATYPSLQLAVIIAAIPVLAAIEIRVTTRWELKQRLRIIALYLAALGLSLCVVAAAIWFGYRWLSLPPGDWIGYLSFATVGFFRRPYGNRRPGAAHTARSGESALLMEVLHEESCCCCGGASAGAVHPSRHGPPGAARVRLRGAQHAHCGAEKLRIARFP